MVSLQKDIQILRNSLELPRITCGIAHETNGSHQACIYGRSPRLQVGCAHSDIPLILSRVLLHKRTTLSATQRRSFLHTLLSIQQELKHLDNDVYEKRLQDEHLQKKQQEVLALKLSALIKKVLSTMFFTPETP